MASRHLETAIPYKSVIAPIMEVVWGFVECWWKGANTWSRVLLQSGCREGMELRRVWSGLCAEAVEASDWLGEDVMEVHIPSQERGSGLWICDWKYEGQGCGG